MANETDILDRWVSAVTTLDKAQLRWRARALTSGSGRSSGFRSFSAFDDNIKAFEAIIEGRRSYRFESKVPTSLDWDEFAKNIGRLINRQFLEPPFSGSPLAFAAKVYRIEGVLAVYVKMGTGSINHLWTLVDRDEYDLREQVYDAESQMYTEYPDQLFDFYVLTASRIKRDIGETIPSDFSFIPRQVAHAIGRGLSGTSRA